MAEVARSEGSSPDTDKDFDPSAEMLVHDYDDERTLEEEEGHSGGSCSGELDDLQRESDMPLEDLLVLYKVSENEPNDDEDDDDDNYDNTRSSSEEEILTNRDLTLDKEEIARDLLANEAGNREPSVNELMDSVTTVTSSSTARLLRSANSVGGESSDESNDGDYVQVQESDWKKTIQIGSDFQAKIPPGLSVYGDAPAYENEDRLLWDPSMLEIDNKKYLISFNDPKLTSVTGVDSIPQGSHVRDDEQGLYLLLQCGHNVDEALRRKQMQAVPPADPMSLWSEEECQNFENGLRIYGKDFYYIQQNKVRTRSVGELVQFYYLWKKTERHDVFAAKTRLEKRKYALHPGITDYMEHFVDEHEGTTLGGWSRDRSASPHNYTCLIYGDHKYQHHHHGDSTSSPHKRSHSPTRLSNHESKHHASHYPSHRGDYQLGRSSLSVSEPLHKKIKTDPDIHERNGRRSPSSVAQSHPPHPPLMMDRSHSATVIPHSHPSTRTDSSMTVVKDRSHPPLVTDSSHSAVVKDVKDVVSIPPKDVVHIDSPSPTLAQ